jgi:CheY-like chemotaxis protein
MLTWRTATQEITLSTGEPMHRILLVDDIDDVRNTLARVLEMWGHEVEKVASGLACVDTFAQFKPQIVLIDIGLPDIDGYEVARRLRALPEGPQVKLIAMTGYDELADKQAAFTAGFDQHFTKPLDLPKLEASLTTGR